MLLSPTGAATEHKHIPVNIQGIIIWRVFGRDIQFGRICNFFKFDNYIGKKNAHFCTVSESIYALALSYSK